PATIPFFRRPHFISCVDPGEYDIAFKSRARRSFARARDQGCIRWAVVVGSMPARQDSPPTQRRCEHDCKLDRDTREFEFPPPGGGSGWGWKATIRSLPHPRPLSRGGERGEEGV